MISKLQLVEEVLELVDANPLTEIDIKPLLDKYSAGLDFNEQRTLRHNLDGVLADLRKNGDITCRNLNFSGSSGGQWMGNTGLIASTIKRREKLEQIKRENNKNEPKKIEKPKWLTFSFYWEELIKHWYKLILLTIGVYILGWLGFRTSKDKELNKQEQNQTPAQIDTTQIKKADSNRTKTPNKTDNNQISDQNISPDSQIKKLLKEARDKMLSNGDKINKFKEAYSLVPENQKSSNFIENLDNIYDFTTQVKLLDSFFIKHNYKY